ncbi:MAG: hypothetical protein JWP60_3146 [Ramlibacter sp.]|nr:hypothetical protein [Ramlibacter sp.]
MSGADYADGRADLPLLRGAAYPMPGPQRRDRSGRAGVSSMDRIAPANVPGGFTCRA